MGQTLAHNEEGHSDHRQLKHGGKIGRARNEIGHSTRGRAVKSLSSREAGRKRQSVSHLGARPRGTDASSKVKTWARRTRRRPVMTTRQGNQFKRVGLARQGNSVQPGRRPIDPTFVGRCYLPAAVLNHLGPRFHLQQPPGANGVRFVARGRVARRRAPPH